MESLNVALEAVFPLFIIMALGFVLNRFKVVSETGFENINRMLFKVLLPILVFNSVYKANVSDLFKSKTLLYLIVFTIAIFVIYYFIILLLEKENSRRAVMLQGVIRTSALLFGLPLATSILDESQMGIVTIAATFTIPFNNILPTLSFSLYTDYKQSVWKNVKNIFTNPIVIGMFLAIVVKLLDWQIPQIIYSPIQKLAAVASPLALIVIGGTCKLTALKKYDPSLLFTVLSKILIIPLIAVTIGYFLGLRGADIVAVLLVTSGPTSVSSYPQTVAADGDRELSNNIIVYTMFFGIFTSVAFIAALGYFAII